MLSGFAAENFSVDTNMLAPGLPRLMGLTGACRLLQHAQWEWVLALAVAVRVSVVRNHA